MEGAVQNLSDTDRLYLNKLWSVSRDPLALADDAGNVVKVNRHFEQFFQLTAQQSVNRNLNSLITPPQFLAEACSIFEKSISGTPLFVPTLRMKGNGELVSVFQITVGLLSDAAVKQVCFVFRSNPEGSGRRATDRLSREEILDNVFERSWEPSLYTSPDDKIVKANSAFQAEFGWTSAETQQKKIDSLMCSSSMEAEFRYISSVIDEGNIIQLKTTRLSKDGTSIPVSLVCAPAKSTQKNISGYRIYRTSSSIARTIAEINAKNIFGDFPRRELYPGIFFVSKVDASRTIEFISPGSSLFIGLPEHEILSHNPSFISFVLNEDRDMVLDAIQNSLSNQKPYNITYRIVSKTGKILWVMERGRAYISGSERVGFCAGSIVDISETKTGKTGSDDTRERIEKLHGVAARLQHSRTAGEVYRICAEAGQSILNGACSSIFVKNKEGGMKQVSNAGRQHFNCTRNCNSAMAELAIGSANPCYFRSRDAEDSFCPAGNSGVCFRLDENTVFQVISKSSTVFGDFDTRIIELLLGYTQQSLKRIALQHKLISQALHDPLTGIYNRSYFNRIIELEEHRAVRLNSSIGFMMIDIDNFKRVNDNFGHSAGDRVLQEVAKILQHCLRATDTVLRYGGDEFLIILTRMAGDHCHMVESRIHKSIAENRELEMPDGTHITVSIGHAFWTPDAKETIDRVLGLADSRMYNNKKAGVRNR